MASIAANINAASAEAVNPTTSAKVLDRTELTLLQLCFDESEFGVPSAAPAPLASNGAASPSPSGSGKAVNSTGGASPGASVPSANNAASLFQFDAAQFVTEKLQHVPLAVLEGDLRTYHKFLQNAILVKIHDSVHEAFVQVSGRLVGTQDELTKIQAPLRALLNRVEGAVGALEQLKANVDTHLRKASAFEHERVFNAGLLQLLLMHDRLCETTDSLADVMGSLGIVVEDSYDSKNTSPSKAVAAATGQQQEKLQQRSPTTPHPPPPPPQQANPDAKQVAEQNAALRRLLSLLNAAVVEIVHMREIQASLHETPAAAVPGAPYAEERETMRELVAEDAAAVLRCLAAALLDAHRRMMMTVTAPTSELTSVFSGLLRCYQLLGEEHAAAALFREQLVRPVVEDVVSWKRAADARQNAPDAERLIAQVCEKLDEQVFAILPLICDALVPAVYPLSAIVWPIVSEVIQKRMSFLFVPGIPATFHANYLLAHRLVAAVEAKCSSVDELRELRASPDMATVWRRKWNTEVYYTLRAAELQEQVKRITATTSLNMAVGPARSAASQKSASSPVSTGTSVDGPFASSVRCQQLHGLRDAMLWGLTDEVFLYPLAAQFVKGALTAQSVVLDHLIKLSGAAVNEEEDIDISKALQLCADLKQFSFFISDTFVRRVEAVTGESATAHGSPLQPIAKLAVAATTSARSKVLAGLRAHVVSRCNVALQSIRSIKAVFVIKTKPLPSSPSLFVSGIVTPIMDFKRAAEAQSALPQAEVHELLLGIVEEVVTRFRSVAREMLTADRKLKENWGKYRNRKAEATGGAGAGAPAAAPDSASAAPPAAAPGAPNPRPTNETATALDKMIVQIYLDVHELGSLLRPLGINKESYAPLQATLRMVRRANWILGDDIPEPPEIEDEEAPAAPAATAATAHHPASAPTAAATDSSSAGSVVA